LIAFPNRLVEASRSMRARRPGLAPELRSIIIFIADCTPGSIPVTWVTVHSGDMGNTEGLVALPHVHVLPGEALACRAATGP
jgi:hypothetical protein